MKAIKIFMTLAVALAAFTSCKDDNASNPTIKQPETFQLNTPAFATTPVDLENSASLPITWKQPDYGYTAPVMYYIQMSLTGEFKEAVNDENGKETTPATYLELDDSYTVCSANLLPATIDRNIIKLSGIEEKSQVPEEMDLYIRLRAKLNAGYQCYSNIVKVKVRPYFVPLTAHDPIEWYLVGGNIGDGTWSMGAECVGTSLVPMTIQDASFYDELTGEGILLYTGYFTANQGFKYIMDPSDKTWTNQYGLGADPVTVGSWFKLDRNNGGSGNINVPADGYYKVELDTKGNLMQLNALESEPNCYAQMGIAGGFNGWSFTEMTPVNTVEGMKNHIWKVELETGDTELKFLSDSSWAHNWGGKNFPYGTGVSGGDNIPVKAGKYLIIFNDIDGFYYFIKK